MEDLYKILGVGKNCSKEQIKTSYRNSSKTHHPDKKGDSVMFNKINNAYKILMDDKKRRRYDKGESVDSVLKPEGNKALALLAQILLQAIQQIDVNRNDIMQLVKSKLEQSVCALNQKINEQKQLKSKFDIFLKNLKYKRKNNIVSDVIKANIVGTNSIIKKIEEEKKVYIEAQKMIKDFGYDFEQEIPVQFICQSATSTGTWG